MKKISIFALLIAVIGLVSCGDRNGDTVSSARFGGDASAESALAATMSSREVPPNPVEKVNADGVVVTHAISMRSEPGYPADYKHFDYVNPEAPKGGTVVLAATGTFDNFNRYARRGDSVPGGELFYDSMMVSSLDEIGVHYGLIAEKIEYSPDYTWIIFHLRPEARHQDGKPIVAEDVVFSFETFRDQGITDLKTYLEGVEAEALDGLRVKFTLGEGDKEMFMFLGSLKILPPQYWRDRNFSEPLTEVPLGSGAYTVSDYAMGQYVVYERSKNYWAMDLPVNRGQLNFDFIRYDMYRDQIVQLEALKAGEIDLRVESVSKQWATQYTGPNFDAGYVLKEEFPDESPATIQRYAFNVQQEVFGDWRVREAVGYLMDFEWLNKNLFHDHYTRTRSYFQGTPFEAMGLPSPGEMEILEAIRDQIPEEVFTAEYQPPETDGSGNIRPQMAAAIELLGLAGWKLRDQVMTNVETGEPLAFELLMYSSNTERSAIPFQENLKKIGITMNLRLVDTTQYINRVREKDFDMISIASAGTFFPGSGLPQRWHSDYVESTWNVSGVQDPAVDYLLDGIIANLNDNQALVPWTRALDRVFQWNHYGVLQWHSSVDRVAYWDKFDRPAVKPKYDLGTGTWWIDPEKAAALPAG